MLDTVSKRLVGALSHGIGTMEQRCDNNTVEDHFGMLAHYEGQGAGYLFGDSKQPYDELDVEGVILQNAEVLPGEAISYEEPIIRVQPFYKVWKGADFHLRGGN